ncbi:TIGR01244 family sulfur transferase [Aquabacterium sp. A7-Y]|uniref:TIGR01244 family sulfur transferase n=1 Tax=Aquabacterium sp. A7-Y TaxID=1349605 RepID=UPI00223DE36F|nr:TIGR01244 family sulfur transferase [Aquabacterium sp. A7-Y]MCW7537580.1 TIGR01244 family sulfur transferase [Aquabacterium sp. A7-Y]
MSLPIQPLSPELCVAPQLAPAAMQQAAEAGFRSVINNRPDHEGGPDQPTSAEMEAAARAAGLDYVHLPVSPSVQTPEQIARFAELLQTLPKPVLAFCRSGGRCTRLFQAATRA